MVLKLLFFCSCWCFFSFSNFSLLSVIFDYSAHFVLHVFFLFWFFGQCFWSVCFFVHFCSFFCIFFIFFLCSFFLCLCFFSRTGSGWSRANKIKKVQKMKNSRKDHRTWKMWEIQVFESRPYTLRTPSRKKSKTWKMNKKIKKNQKKQKHQKRKNGKKMKKKANLKTNWKNAKTSTNQKNQKMKKSKNQKQQKMINTKNNTGLERFSRFWNIKKYFSMENKTKKEGQPQIPTRKVNPNTLSFFLWCCCFWSPPPLGGVASPISFQVVLPSFPSFVWGCVPLNRVAFSALLFGGAARFPLLWVVLPAFSSSGWSCFSTFFWSVLLGFFLWVVFLFFLVLLPGACCLSSPPLGTAASFISCVGWCCLVFLLWVVLLFPSSFPWCCLPFRPSGGGAFSLLFGWVVLLSLLLLSCGVAVQNSKKDACSFLK